MGFLRPLARSGGSVLTVVGALISASLASANLASAQPAPTEPPPTPAPTAPNPSTPESSAPESSAPESSVPGTPLPAAPAPTPPPYPTQVPQAPPPMQYAPVAPPGWGPPPDPSYQRVIPGTPMPIGALPHYMRPRKLKFDEDLPMPPGYHVETGPNKRIMLAGGITFLSAYVISALSAGGSVAEEETAIAPLFIPIAGPFITLGTAEVRFEGGQQAGGILLILDGVAQLAGATLFIIGAAVDQRHLERDRAPGYAEASPRPGPQVEFIAKPGGAAARLTY